MSLTANGVRGRKNAVLLAQKLKYLMQISPNETIAICKNILFSQTSN